MKSNRIDEICKLVPNCDKLADVGCDHGYIGEKLLKLGKAKKVIFSDISEKCLKKAQKLAGCYNTASFVVSDGLKNVGKVDVAVIAGMGGIEIKKILTEADFAKYYILSPQKNQFELRAFLSSSLFLIEQDYTVEEKGKYYDIIKVTHGEKKLTVKECYFGITDLEKRPAVFLKRVENELFKYKNYLNKMSETDKKIEGYKQYVMLLEEILNEDKGDNRSN